MFILIDMLVNDSSLVFKDGFTFNNGSTYKGQGKDQGDSFIKHGYGILTWPDGAKYQGYFKDDAKEGRGLLVRSDGNVYEGKILRSINFFFIIFYQTLIYIIQVILKVTKPMDSVFIKTKR